MASMIFKPVRVISTSSSGSTTAITDNLPDNFISLYGDIVLGYDFSYLPENATITGIKVRIEARRDGAQSNKTVRLLDSGTVFALSDGTLNAGNFSYEVRETKVFDFPLALNDIISDPTLLSENRLACRFYNGGTLFRVFSVDIEIEYKLPTITVTTEASPAEGGTVTGGGTYESGSTVTLTATPNRGYAFSHWQIGETVVGTENPISGSLTTDATVTAVFIEKPSKVYCGTKKCSVYAGTKKVGVYAGTKKLS
ncbi:MAG: hypothetical protein E7535_08555 [Ruminococcaceae bacterium]|nr:hypothetical protein [Oscillospiraceae bacterium]